MREMLRFGKIDYVIRYPENFECEKRYPLLVYLHGAGGRGRDTEVLRNHSFFEDSEKYCRDVVTVVPQCYANTWFDMYEQLMAYLEAMCNLDFVDPDRVYVMGASMGGYTTWQVGMSRPDLFAAIVPICGGGMYWNAARLKHMAVWAFHGDADTTVSCEESKKMVAAIKKRGGLDNARLTIYEGVPHNSWTPTFQNAEMWAWMFAQRRHYEEVVNEFGDPAKFG